jgi:hypothetical protein
MPLVSEQVLLEHRHAGNDPGLAAGREGVELELGRDERCCEFCIRGSTRSGAPDLRSNVVKLLTVLERPPGQ